MLDGTVNTVEFQLDEAQPASLTNWANEPTVMKLKQDLDASKPAHDTHVNKVKKWNDLMAVKGASAPKHVKGRSSVQPKLIRRQAEWRYSALTEPFLSSDKLFNVKPVTYEDTKAAAQNETVLNWQFNTKINKVKFFDDFVRINVDEGSCVVRIGWQRITTTVTEDLPTWDYFEITDPQDAQFLQQALEQKAANPREYEDTAPEEIKAAVDYYEENEIPTTAVLIGYTPTPVEKVLLNQPTLECLDPENVFIDPSCGNDVNKAGFVVVSFETSRAELLKEPNRYKNLDRVNWEAASILSQPDHATNTPQEFNYLDKLRKRIVAYEYWGYYDIHNDETLVPIVATWINDTLIRLEESPFPDEKPPFVVSNYMPIKRALMGEPDAEILEDNQKIVGAVTRGMIDLMARSANAQQGFAKGFLDIVNRRRFENGQDYEYNPTQHPGQSFVEHKYPEIPQSALAMIGLQNNEAESMTGVKAFAGGVSGDAYGDVAAGIRGALDAASKREMGILRRLAKAVNDIATKIIAMNAVFLSEKEVIRVTNEEFITIKREDLKGNFDTKTDIATAEVDEAKAQDLGFMLQTIGPNMDFSMTQLILVEIAKLKRMPELAKRIEMFKPQPDPMVQKMKELELRMKEVEIMELETQAMLNQAKAKNELTKANQGDLNIIEQETGTAHEREMEKTRGQSEGNQNLEITKALVGKRKPEETKPDVEAAIGWGELSKSKRPADTGQLI